MKAVRDVLLAVGFVSVGLGGCKAEERTFNDPSDGGVQVSTANLESSESDEGSGGVGDESGETFAGSSDSDPSGPVGTDPEDTTAPLSSATSGTEPEPEVVERECVAGTEQPCWETPEGEALEGDPALLQGDCHQGLRTCGLDGFYGACVGAQGPGIADSCELAGADEDCDGTPNEGCPCLDTETRACGIDTGNCQTGTQVCSASVWGPCEGAIGEEAQDSCAVEGDDADCDGTPNGGCGCVADETEACGDCGERTCQPEVREFGACVGLVLSEICWETEDGTPLPGTAPEMPLGNCRLGERVCSSDGSWNACAGAVAPATQDSCELAGDDASCNGASNEGCPCTTGESRSCGSAVGNCEEGTQTCVAGVWGDCEDDIVAVAQDSCAIAGDDANCDGDPNGGCGCIGDETQSCNDCGTAYCNPAARGFGPCEASQNPAEQRCDDDGTAVLTCDTSGNWVTESCQSNEGGCIGQCVELAGGAVTCSVQALDADGDTYPSAACTGSPGDDCDDGDGSVNPGAAEVCDGLDNNCNQVADLADGLGLAGAAGLIAGRTGLDVAWSPTASQFGIIANDTTLPGIFYGTLSTLGVVVPAADSLIATNSTTAYFGQRIAWGPNTDAFGVIYSTGNAGGVGAEWIRVDTGGNNTSGYPLPQGQNGGIATLQNGELAIAHRHTGVLYFGRLVNGLGYSPGDNIPEAALDPRVATSGDLSAVIWQVANTNTVNWARVSASSVFGNVEQLSAAGQNPDVAGHTLGYALGWVTAAGFEIQLVSNSGLAACSPTPIAFGNGALEQGDGIALEISAGGLLALVTDAGGNAIHLFRFDASCSVLDQADVHPGASMPQQPNMAVGDGNVALVWTEETSNARMGYVRVMSEALCQ